MKENNSYGHYRGLGKSRNHDDYIKTFNHSTKEIIYVVTMQYNTISINKRRLLTISAFLISKYMDYRTGFENSRFYVSK